VIRDGSAVDEKALGAINAGREAALALQIMRPVFDEQYDGLVTRALSRYRADRLSPTDAYVFVGALASLCDFRDELESRVVLGDVVANKLAN
jgi:hypothetical protein